MHKTNGDQPIQREISRTATCGHKQKYNGKNKTTKFQTHSGTEIIFFK